MPAYCKQHAQAGMVDVRSKPCSYDSCSRRPTYNVRGLKTPVYCKQHAEEGMVNVRRKETCRHDPCIRRPYFNAEGRKTAVYCKQHAEDGMVDIRNKRCSHDSCMRRPSFNLEGNKIPAFCKQHAADSMVNVCTKRCLHGSCKSHALFNADGSKTPMYCKRHALDGMVNVRTRRSLHDYRTTRPPLGVPPNVAAPTPTQHGNDTVYCSMRISDSPSELVDCRKQSQLVRNEKQPPHSLNHGPYKEGGVVQTVEMSSCEDVLYTSSSGGIRRLPEDSAIGTAAKQTRQRISLQLAPLAGQRQSSEPIKTEMGLVVSF